MAYQSPWFQIEIQDARSDFGTDESNDGRYAASQRYRHRELVADSFATDQVHPQPQFPL